MLSGDVGSLGTSIERKSLVDTKATTVVGEQVATAEVEDGSSCSSTVKRSKRQKRQSSRSTY